MHLEILSRLLLLVLSWRKTLCFASSSLPAIPRVPIENDDGNNSKKFEHQPTTPIRIASLNKYGGNIKFFDLDAGENANTDTNNTVTRFSRIKNPCIFVAALRKKIKQASRTTFLPLGYPEKTQAKYFEYCVWSWIQDASTQLRSVLATQKILEGVGVGKEGATALSALFNFLVRDGCGMFANLSFTYAASSRFRTDVKRWRIFADTCVDIGITLEVAATLFPKSFFLPCICLGNMFKALCGVAAGASGGSINLYWAKGSDISDINAKFGAQHTVTGAIGLIFAGLFANSVSKVSPHSLWLMYFFLTYLHLYGNIRCMRLISFDYLNTNRLDMILRNYVNEEDESQRRIPIPKDIAKAEPLWFQIPILGHIRKKSPSIHFGVAFDEFCRRSGKPVEALRAGMIRAIENENDTVNDGYIISTGGQTLSSSGKTKHPKSCVVVSFFSDVSQEQQTKAYVHAWLLAKTLQDRPKKEASVMDFKSQLKIEAETMVLFKSMWKKFDRSCTLAGWDLSKSELQTNGYEVEVV